MFKFSTKSEQLLNTVQKELSVLAHEVIKISPIDFSITEGFRDRMRQKELYNEGKSRTLNSKHCLDIDTEILTNNGWKNINTISKDDLCYSFNMETEKIEKTEILEIIKQKRKEKLIQIKNKHIDLLLTDKHNILLKTFNNQYKSKNIKNYSNSEYHNNLKKNYRLEKAENIFNKRIKIPVCAFEYNEKSIYDLDYLKLLIAIICDGSISKDKNCNSYDIHFNLKKERKIVFLENLLKKLNIEYSKKYCKSREKINQYGVFHINILGGKKIKQKIVDIITENKIIPDFFLNLSVEEKQDLIETYIFFDGCKNKKYNNSNVISSIKEENIDKLQIMCITSNYRCIKNKIKSENLKTSFKNVKDIYHLYIVKNKNTSRINEKISYSYVDYDNYVWCISNKNHTIIVRRNGKVSIVGNCECKAIDIVCCKEGYTEPLRDIYIVIGLFLAKAKELNIKIRVGALWDKTSTKDNNFLDAFHIELV